MSKRKPLTLEELRKMDDKPVLVESDSDYIPGGVYLCEWCDWKEEARLWSYEGENWFIGKYDKGVKVYAYAEPPRLDRSAWEPCEHCKPSKNPLDRWGPHQFPIDGNEIYCYDIDDGWEGEEINFCPWCSRPLTDAAWKMLEKRLDGSE